MTHLARHALAAFALLLPLAALPAAADDSRPVPQLTATGEGLISAVPDMASITLGVVSEAATAADALARNSTDMTATIAAIKASGVAEKDIGTTGFNVGPVYSNPQPKPDGTIDQPRITGYQVSNQVRVVIRDLTKAGAVLDAVVKAGANQAAAIEFGLTDRKAATDAALKAAIADAKAKAALMAEAAGVKLGKLLSIQANENGGQMPRYDMAMAKMAAAPEAPVMAGERQIQASATLVYEIDGK